MDDQPSKQPPQDSLPSDAPDAQRIVRSEELFQGGKQVIIEHEDKHYRLLCTKNGKLILQK